MLGLLLPADNIDAPGMGMLEVPDVDLEGIENLLWIPFGLRRSFALPPCPSAGIEKRPSNVTPAWKVPCCSKVVTDSGARDRERLVGRQSIDIRDLDLLMALQSIGAILNRRETSVLQLSPSNEKKK